MAPNMHHSLFLIHHFVCTYMHNSKTTGRVRTFYILNNWSTVGDTYSVFSGLELHARYNGWVMAPKMHHSLFHSDMTFYAYSHNSKLQVVYRRSAYRATASLLEMSIFWVRATCEIWLASYGSKHASQSLSDMPFVHILPRITWKLQIVHVYGCSAYGTTASLSKTFLVWFRVVWDDQTGELWFQTHITVVLWYNILYIVLHIWCTTMHACQQNSNRAVAKPIQVVWWIINEYN